MKDYFDLLILDNPLLNLNSELNFISYAVYLSKYNLLYRIDNKVDLKIKKFEIEDYQIGSKFVFKESLKYLKNLKSFRIYYNYSNILEFLYIENYIMLGHEKDNFNKVDYINDKNSDYNTIKSILYDDYENINEEFKEFITENDWNNMKKELRNLNRVI